ncbi:peptidase M23 [Streptomyces albus]|uniref:peptidase M23 n=1 Tax=Streptomyces albus TaxID=1888 RepID=UPI0033C5043A
MQQQDALRLAAGAAGRGLMLKLGLPGAAIAFAMLLLLGVLGAFNANEAMADEACGDRGSPQTTDAGSDSGSGKGQGRGGNLRRKQIKNAKIIDGVAKAHGLSGKATLIALMTALQESTLINLDHGHADSVGIFQQRAAWGPKADRMNVKKSAKMFFYGGQQGQPGLTDIKGWQHKAPGIAAQDVQRSLYPEMYAGQEAPARKIAKEAGIDLDRSGTRKEDEEEGPSQEPGRSGQANDRTGTGVQGLDGCYGHEPGTGAAGKKAKGKFSDGRADGWPKGVKNHRSTAEAIAWARRQVDGPPNWERLCLRFVSTAYGFGPTRQYRAIEQWQDTPARMKHAKDRHPPKGALMYWSTGAGRAGHVALYIGDGKIASNDIRRPGYIDIVPAAAIEKDWGSTYLGWTAPLFP